MSEELSVKEKLKILQNTAIKDLEKKFGENSYFFGDKKIPKVPLVCSSGSLSLDTALCIGGFPEGRIIEIGGQESSGKSTLTLINIAEVQKSDKLCAYIDAEQSFDPVWAARMGVDVDKLLVTQPDTAEEAFEQLYAILDSGVVSYIVVDSTNSLIPKRLFEGEVGDASMGLAARILSQELPKVRTKCTNTKCTVVFLSQVRSKIGGYGNPDVIGIGNAMKFYASIRIKTSKAELEKDDGDQGQSSVDVIMNIFKNKVGVPYKKASFTLLTGLDGKYGIDNIKEIIEYAVRYEIVKKAGAWFTFESDRFQGMANIRKYFEENPSQLNRIKSIVMEKLQKEREELQTIAANTNFDNELDKAIEENSEGKTRKRRTKETVEEAPVVLDESKISEGEVVEE